MNNKTLIIAEKPSVANDISKALGKFTKKNDFFENECYVITSSIGHLLTLIAPNEPKKGKWNLNNLPVIPDIFELSPTDKKCAEKLKNIIKIIKRKDIDTIINACDAGREGELIFKYIIQYSKSKKPIKRLWLQSMTKTAICDAFNNLRDNEQMKSLEDAARSRAEADWLIGINGTRAITAFNSLEGGFYKTTVGRVQTPTLYIVENRENKIRNFKAKEFWEIHAKFIFNDIYYQAKWIDINFKKDKNFPEKNESRIWSLDKVNSIIESCQKKEGTAKDEIKISNQSAPLLFDLTSLQREANNKFGFSAKTTLSLAQNLYEKHKCLTYPRTDSKYLPEDYLTNVYDTLNNITKSETDIDNIKKYASKIIQKKWLCLNKKIFDNKKISDHFAIIPTPQLPNNLNELEYKIYNLVLKRFLAIFFPAAEYEIVTRTTNINSNIFINEYKVLKYSGWLEVYNKTNENNIFPKIKNNDVVKVDKIEKINEFTKPPAHYNEATLLSTMEVAGKLIEDDELREAMINRGLGTPATRAFIIEGLIKENYIRRENKDLITTAKARQLVNLLSGLNIKELTSPELTGEWEYKLKQIEQGNLNRYQFMSEIVTMSKNIVQITKEYKNDTVPGNYVTLKHSCILCNGIVKENYRKYACINCNFYINKYLASRMLDIIEIEELLKNKQIGPLSGFLSKSLKPFSASLKINDEGKLEFDFHKNEKHCENFEIINDISLGNCPICKLHNVVESKNYYICEKNGNFENNCNFLCSKKILNQIISRDQMNKLLNNGKTDLLENFISIRTKRKFKAIISIDSKGKIKFIFNKNNVNNK
ncbi:DNA topoisomerase 3 [Candidatus Kinetoplastibacterium sorsogonicusi]|uniref:DNA topoisomerase n=1 Tax=Candidatus Kinetoplastidibacterium kentomonadis TaxID=1576550 RepID=A0A3S7J924_9PROT|nr:DNA topoisomerase III [Candidatus Kinetoplastibacterium sorsogonicusi]AWD32151.1 DNA topoisomerase 3 [Candidatus Kinetoplastibacterium sorsogonicusi]